MFSDQKVETLPGGSQVIVLFCRREDIVLLHATVATAHSEALNGDVNSNVLITPPPRPPRECGHQPTEWAALVTVSLKCTLVSCHVRKWWCQTGSDFKNMNVLIQCYLIGVFFSDIWKKLDFRKRFGLDIYTYICIYREFFFWEHFDLPSYMLLQRRVGGGVTPSTGHCPLASTSPLVF